MTTKECITCLKIKDTSEFYIVKSRNNYFYPSCKECHKKYLKKWREENKEKANGYSVRFNRLKKTGCTQEMYEELFNTQLGKCAICGIEQKDAKIQFAADHWHTTGAIRGLLCVKCNTALGKFNDDVRVLEKAIMYLNKD